MKREGRDRDNVTKVVILIISCYLSSVISCIYSTLHGKIKSTGSTVNQIQVHRSHTGFC